jgi:RNA polymerase sigma factor (sigma-70 family)
MAVQRPFEEIVAAHGSVVMRVCRALLGPTDAEDAWAETFLSALRSYPTLRPDSNVRGWLVTIAHRKAIDQIRASARTPRPTDRLPEAVATEGNPGSAPDTELWAALAALPPKQRAAVVYHHVAGLPYAEVGDLLETSEAAARRSAADGIARLRQHYQEESPR